MDKNTETWRLLDRLNYIGADGFESIEFVPMDTGAERMVFHGETIGYITISGRFVHRGIVDSIRKLKTANAIRLIAVNGD